MIRMIAEPPRIKRKFHTGWGELDYLCERIHYWWYTRQDKRPAKRFLDRLERVLASLPADEMAILREEGLALLHELKSEKKAAIKHRRHEIELMERLHRSVRDSVKNGDYDAKMAASILMGRDVNALNERQAILKRLEEAISSAP